MNIIGGKVILRAIEYTDCNMFLELINDPDTERMLGGMSFPVSQMEQEQWIAKQVGSKNSLRCVVAERDRPSDGLGTVILTDMNQQNGTAQIHIKMTAKSRGKGFGTEALRVMIRYAFEELRLNCLYADILSYNETSQRVFQKTGFRRDGILRARVYKGGRYIDVHSYSLLREDWTE